MRRAVSWLLVGYVSIFRKVLIVAQWHVSCFKQRLCYLERRNRDKRWLVRRETTRKIATAGHWGWERARKMIASQIPCWKSRRGKQVVISRQLGKYNSISTYWKRELSYLKKGKSVWTVDETVFENDRKENKKTWIFDTFGIKKVKLSTNKINIIFQQIVGVMLILIVF